jgi:iron complex outermembrane recepter protein
VLLLRGGPVSGRTFTFGLGVDNRTGKAPPACYSCLLNNYDPSTYDLPGPFFYTRVGVKF